MATEKIDVVIKTSLETNLEKITKEFNKILPTIKKQISSIKEAFEKINIGDIVDVSQVSGKLEEIKKQIKSAFLQNSLEVLTEGVGNTLNNLSETVNNTFKDDGFQEWLENCAEKCKEISEKLETINWQPLIDALTQIGTSVGTVALDILNGLVDIFKWLAENPMVAEILLAIAAAIGVVSTALTIWSTVQKVLNSDLIASPITWIVLAITALIAILILCVVHWEEIKNAVSNAWETIKNAVAQVIEPIKQYLVELWNNVSVVFAAIWQIISTIFQAIWNIISSILGSIWNIFSQIFNWIWQLVSKVFEGIWNVISPIINRIWDAIKYFLEKVKQMWSSIWNNISNVVKNIWNGIWSAIKSVINLILGGIEGFVNGAIKGINFLLRGISNVANAIGHLIGLSPINLQISLISLPRLAKGGIINSPTIALIGEYSGARNNPEIVTPQNIMAETFRNEMVDILASNGNSNKPIRVQVYWGTKNVVDEIINGINEKTRQTGKAQIKVAYNY